MTDAVRCRVCGSGMTQTFVDLGMIPLCQTYIEPARLEHSEVFHPLHARACLECTYVGLPEYVAASDIFTEYAYFSSYSTSWVQYIRQSVSEMVARYDLGPSSQVIEMASNDGYLLQFFAERDIPALGVEPAANVAQVANERGLRTLPEFFNRATAQALVDSGVTCDLLLAYNCLDHVPDLHDVVAGMKVLLKPGGVIHVELPYLRSMVDGNEWDTIYHDRYSYLSLTSVDRLFARHGLHVFDAERIPTHGGSLRFRAGHEGTRAREPRVDALLAEEAAAGLHTAGYFAAFMRQAARTKHDLLAHLVDLKRQGASIVGYGVPAKGNVLLNYCGIRGDFLDYLVDRSPYKQGKHSPGTRLPIHKVERIGETRPSHIFILPWNIRDEIVEQMAFATEWGAEFFVAIPQVETVRPQRKYGAGRHAEQRVVS